VTAVAAVLVWLLGLVLVVIWSSLVLIWFSLVVIWWLGIALVTLPRYARRRPGDPRPLGLARRPCPVAT